MVHPDKGGDADQFREVQTAFEVLRKIADEESIASFADAADDSTADAYSDAFGGVRTQSWEFFSAAATETVPTYRAELAKSGRSKCTQKGKKAKKCTDEFIPKGLPKWS